MRERTITLADRLFKLAMPNHPRVKELLDMASAYDAAMNAVMEPCENWPNRALATEFNITRRRAIQLYYDCGGKEDVHG